MNGLILCTVATLNIFSMPAGNTAGGSPSPPLRPSPLWTASLLRDWIFIGKPDPQGGVASPRGWVKYEYLGYCPQEGSGQ